MRHYQISQGTLNLVAYHGAINAIPCYSTRSSKWLDRTKHSGAWSCLELYSIFLFIDILARHLVLTESYVFIALIISRREVR